MVSTVGAGDCTLFGYLLAELRGLSAPDRLALAVAYGAAAAGLPGTTIPGPDDLHPERVDVQQLDPVNQEIACPASPSPSARPSACTPGPPRSSPRRPAGLGSTVTINGVDAGSSLMIMTLGAKCGDTVEVAGEDQSAVDSIAALVEQDLDAD